MTSKVKLGLHALFALFLALCAVKLAVVTTIDIMRPNHPVSILWNFPVLVIAVVLGWVAYRLGKEARQHYLTGKRADDSKPK